MVTVGNSRQCSQCLPAQLFSLAGLGVVFHADMVGVEFMTRDVGEELREVQPPQELHRLRMDTVTHTARGEAVVEWECEGQRQGKNRTRVEVRTATGAPAEGSPDQKVFPLRVHVNS